MTWITWVLAGLAVTGSAMALFFWLVLRVRNRQLDYARISRSAYRGEIKRLCEQIKTERADAEAREAKTLRVVDSLRSQNERLRLWQWRVINGSTAEERHLAEYAREMSDDAQGGEPS